MEDRSARVDGRGGEDRFQQKDAKNTKKRLNFDLV
jgi:hypothetical protein